MPSTKIRKKSIKVGSQVGTVIEKIKVYGEFEKQKQRENFAQILKQLDEKYKISLAMFDKKDLEKTMGQLRKEKEISSNTYKKSNPKDEECNSGFSTSHSSKSRSLSRSTVTNYTGRSDSTGQQLSIMGPPSTFRGNLRQTGNRRRSSSVPNTAARASRARYKTPMSKKMTYPAVTPKVAPNTPLTLLRRPRQGEFVMSIEGSPVLVNGISSMDEMANCNIPLKDGTMLSLMPRKLRQSSTYLPIEHMGPQTITQLQNLHENLGMIVKLINKEKQKK